MPVTGVDSNSVGTGRTYPNPQKAIEASVGQYNDPAERVSIEQKTLQMPQAPQKTPFKLGG